MWKGRAGGTGAYKRRFKSTVQMDHTDQVTEAIYAFGIAKGDALRHLQVFTRRVRDQGWTCRSTKRGVRHVYPPGVCFDDISCKWLANELRCFSATCDREEAVEFLKDLTSTSRLETYLYPNLELTPGEAADRVLRHLEHC